jgi:hypothetical protein
VYSTVVEELSHSREDDSVWKILNQIRESSGKDEFDPVDELLQVPDEEGEQERYEF